MFHLILVFVVDCCCFDVDAVMVTFSCCWHCKLLFLFYFKMIMMIPVLSSLYCWCFVVIVVALLLLIKLGLLCS